MITVTSACLIPLALCAHAAQPPSPGLREGHALVYDERLAKILLLGGFVTAGTTPAPSRDPVWSWDGAKWKPIADSGPPSRTLTTATFDLSRKRILMYGGVIQNVAQTTSETWQWNANGWSKLTDASVGLRDHHMLAYDAARGVTVMYGGTVPLDAANGRPTKYDWPSVTWELRGDTWTRMDVPGPGSRNVASMAYDARRKRVVLFGGYGSDRAYRGDTWTWDGTIWQKVSDIGPPARANHRMVYDSSNGVVWMYGGANATKEFDDMWKWDGVRWEEVKTTGATPGPRGRHAMAYDPARRKVVLYGGHAKRGPLADTWEWDGASWKEMSRG